MEVAVADARDVAAVVFVVLPPQPVGLIASPADVTQIKHRIARGFLIRKLGRAWYWWNRHADASDTLWWALLFGLSNIARYDPETWVDALAVNDSGLTMATIADVTMRAGSAPRPALLAFDRLGQLDEHAGLPHPGANSGQAAARHLGLQGRRQHPQGGRPYARLRKARPSRGYRLGA